METKETMHDDLVVEFQEFYRYCKMYDVQDAFFNRFRFLCGASDCFFGNLQNYYKDFLYEWKADRSFPSAAEKYNAKRAHDFQFDLLTRLDVLYQGINCCICSVADTSL